MTGCSEKLIVFSWSIYAPSLTEPEIPLATVFTNRAIETHPELLESNPYFYILHVEDKFQYCFPIYI